MLEFFLNSDLDLFLSLTRMMGILLSTIYGVGGAVHTATGGPYPVCT